MINDNLPPAPNRSKGVNKKKIDADEYWVSAPIILIILVVAVSIVIYASLHPTQRKTIGVTSDYRVTVK